MSFAFVGRMFQGLKGFYNGINPATLTGAIDVVIVQQEDGSYLSSPFHVRFGKLGVLRSREKVVDIEINGQPTELQMKLGEAGEAFFVHELEAEEEDVPAYLATSPLPSSLQLMEQGLQQLRLQAAGDDRVPEEDDDTTIDTKEIKSDSSVDDGNAKPRRKVFKKKKQRGTPSRSGNSRSISMPDSIANEQAMFDLEVTNSSDEELSNLYMRTVNSSPQIMNMDNMAGTTSHRKMSSLGSFEMTPFSDPENSPFASPPGSRPTTPKSDTEVDRQRTEDSQSSMLMENSATWQWGELPTGLDTSSQDVGGSGGSGSGGRDGEEGKEQTESSSSGFMSMWRQTKPPKSSKRPSEGIYLDDLTLDDPEMTKIYLGRPREKEDDTESGRGQSLPQSPNSVEGAIGGGSPVSFTPSEVKHLGPVSLSLCGGLNEGELITLDKFMQKVVTFDDLAQHPNITMNPDLVVKIHDRFYNWTTAGPMVLSQIVFHKQLPDVVVKDLEKKHMPKKERKKKTSSWFPWSRSSEAVDPEAGLTMSAEEAPHGDIESGSATETSLQKDNPSVQSSPPPSSSSTPRKHRERHLTEESPTSTETDTDASEKELSHTTSTTATSTTTTTTSGASTASGGPQPQQPAAATASSFPISTPSNSEAHSGKFMSKEQTINMDPTQLLHNTSDQSPRKKEQYIKTLRLTSEQISKMNLQDGYNEIVFSVTTQYQGTTRCVSHVYLWHYTDKIVISDIDGTITKSDALGQILPMIGRDWSQSGVAELFTRINNNGYRFIYLSARAIGQSRSTKDMLKNIKQGDLVLPNGPILLNPTSLFNAFHREVIVKNPEEFKISCLKDIAALFPGTPFYAGFGNKFNDVIAYRALDIPSFRIFTINPQGQLRHDLSLAFLSSYSGMTDIVDHFFPCLDQMDRGTSTEYSALNFWRPPLPILTMEDLSGMATIPTAPPATVVAAATTATAADKEKK